MTFRSVPVRAVLALVCLAVLSGGCMSVSSKRAYRGKLDVSQKVDVKAIQSYHAIQLRFNVKNPDLQRFVAPMQTELQKSLPQKTTFATVYPQTNGRQPASNALTLMLEPIEFTGGGMIKMGNEGLKLKASLWDSHKKQLGAAEILATSEDDSTSVGGFKTAGYKPAEVVVAGRTAIHVVNFLKGDD